MWMVVVLIICITVIEGIPQEIKTLHSIILTVIFFFVILLFRLFQYLFYALVYKYICLI